MARGVGRCHLEFQATTNEIPNWEVALYIARRKGYNVSSKQ